MKYYNIGNEINLNQRKYNYPLKKTYFISYNNNPKVPFSNFSNSKPNNYNIIEGNNNKLNHRMKKLYFNSINQNEKIIPGNKNKKSVFISPQISSKRRSIKNNFNFKNSEEKEKGILYNPKHVLSENDMIYSSSLEKIPNDLELERILLSKNKRGIKNEGIIYKKYIAIYAILNTILI